MKRDDKLILFDWGGVMVDQDNKNYSFDRMNTELASVLNAKSTYLFREMFYDYEYYSTRGKELAGVIKKYLKRSGSDKSVDDFKSAYMKLALNVPYFEAVVKMICELPKYCRLGVLSVQSAIDHQVFVKRVDESLFDYCFYSYSFKMDKKDPKLYKTVSDIVGFGTGKINDILYFDDRPDAIKLANEAGWNSKCLTGEDSSAIKEEICKFLNISKSDFAPWYYDGK